MTTDKQHVVGAEDRDAAKGFTGVQLVSGIELLERDVALTVRGPLTSVDENQLVTAMSDLETLYAEARRRGIVRTDGKWFVFS